VELIIDGCCANWNSLKWQFLQVFCLFLVIYVLLVITVFSDMVTVVLCVTN